MTSASIMVTVYTAQMITDAYLIKGLLENHGIPAYVSGEHLQGGIGELPAMGLITVCVGESLADQATALISDFEHARPQLGAEPSGENG
jgi:hypothetical protein